MTLLLAPVAAAAGPDILPLSQVKAGMKGYGLSVFAGTAVERFDVEVLGVVPRAAADRAQIVVRVSGKGLEESGIVAGMSGSPVYLEGKLAGAIASGWGFSKSPIGGVTPIESMLRIDEPDAPGARGAPRAGRPLATGFARLPAEDDEPWRERLESLFEALLPPAPPAGGAGLLAPLVRGFPAASSSRLDSLLPRLGLPLAASGTAAPAARTAPPAPAPASGPLAGGSSIIALLVDGDVQLGATGTVTYAGSDGRFLAFGHPFLGFGELELPVAEAPIVTTLPNLFQSFKIGYPSTPAYRLVRDRDAGVAGRTDGTAPTLPLTVRVETPGAEPTTFSFRLASHPRLVPALLLLSADGALSAADPTPRERTLLFRVSLATSAGEIAYEDRSSGPRAKETALLTAAVLAGTVLDNELEDPKVTAITLAVSSQPGERRLKLVDASLASRKVAPGGTIAVAVRLASRRGEESIRVVRLDVPRETPEGRATLLLADGSVATSTRLGLAPPEPRTLADLKRWTDSLTPTDRLVAALLVPSRGLATGSRTLTSLPPTFAALLGGARASGEGSAGADSRIVAEKVETLDRPLTGSLRLELEIERPRP